MKFSAAFGAAALAGSAAAFPTAVEHLADAPVDAPVAKRQVGGINVKFDPKTQYVPTTGQYKWVAPGPQDLRGPCPGLNAMANHGYLPHNGVANIPQFIEGTGRVFGMGVDLAGFLAVYGAIFDGDLEKWSIGDSPPRDLLNPIGNLLGTPNGITGSHNKYENDVSPTRGDLFEEGNNYKVILSRFKEMYAYQENVSEEESNYDLSILTSLRSRRYTDSVTQNPYFFNAPFPGIEVQAAAFTFIYRFMANKSQEFPEGRLSKNVLKSFFSITGDTMDTMKYTEGYERIPDNWYKRAIGDEYTIPFFQIDLLGQAEQDPRFLEIGGNLGKPNTFTPLDIHNITGGVYNAKNLLEGNNAFCFTYNAIISQGPDLLEGVVRNLADAVAKMNQLLAPFIKGFGCPQLDDQVVAQNMRAGLAKYPGYTKLKKNGQY